MNIEEFVDVAVMQDIQDEFAEATGLAAVMVGEDGEYITKPSNFLPPFLPSSLPLTGEAIGKSPLLSVIARPARTPDVAIRNSPTSHPLCSTTP